MSSRRINRKKFNLLLEEIRSAIEYYHSKGDNIFLQKAINVFQKVSILKNTLKYLHVVFFALFIMCLKIVFIWIHCLLNNECWRLDIHLYVALYYYEIPISSNPLGDLEGNSNLFYRRCIFLFYLFFTLSSLCLLSFSLTSYLSIYMTLCIYNANYYLFLKIAI